MAGSARKAQQSIHLAEGLNPLQLTMQYLDGELYKYVLGHAIANQGQRSVSKGVEHQKCESSRRAGYPAWLASRGRLGPGGGEYSVVISLCRKVCRS